MKSKYETVADLIEERINKGEYSSCEYLPGERALSEELKVSRVTIRNGLGILKHRRVLKPVTGKGYMIMKSRESERKKRTGLIGGVFPGPKHPLSTTIMSESISNVLEENDFHLVYSSSGESLQSEIAKIESLLEKGVDGLILMPSYRRGADEVATADELGNHEYVKKLHDSGVPVVLMDRSYAAGGIPCVCNDDLKGGSMAAEYFIKKGFKEIIYFGVVLDRVGRQRFKGYCDAMKAHGLRVQRHAFKNPQRVIFDEEEKRREIDVLLRGLKNETALITGGYFPASLSAMTKTPDYKGPNVRWTGYDFSVKDMTGPCAAFPYLKRPMSEMGAMAAGKILRLIEGDKTAASEEFLPPEIIEP